MFICSVITWEVDRVYYSEEYIEFCNTGISDNSFELEVLIWSYFIYFNINVLTKLDKSIENIISEEKIRSDWKIIIYSFQWYLKIFIFLVL